MRHLAAEVKWLAGAADRIVSDVAAEARAVWDGFARFCGAELSLAPETVVRAYFPPLLERLERHREALGRAEPDPRNVEEYVEVLTRGWRRSLGPADSGPASRASGTG